MEVLLLNGSPNMERCTYTALRQVAAGLEDNGVGARIHWLGAAPLKPCIGCGACGKTGRCAFGATDGVNALIEEARAADGLVLGSPVYFAGINGSLKSALDRLFFAASADLAFKPGACIVSARRAGTTAALEQLNKYISYAQMPLVGSFYWPMVHGQAAEEVARDEEGMQIAYQLGANMAWLLRCLETGAAAGIRPTQPKTRARTNFVR